MLQDVIIAELVIFLPLKVDSIVSVLASDAFCHLFFKSQAFVYPIVSSVCAKLRTMGCWCTRSRDEKLLPGCVSNHLFFCT